MNVRVIPRLDIKGPNLVKGIHFEGLRVLGKPEDFVCRCYEQRLKTSNNPGPLFCSLKYLIEKGFMLDVTVEGNYATLSERMVV